MKQSIYYQESLEKNTEFQKIHKGWGGWGIGGYATRIKQLVEKHNATSLLDYGCGKGYPYTSPSIFDGETTPKTFGEFLGISDIFLHDPCVETLKELPPADKKFDAVILTQVLPYIPDDDLQWVKELLMSHTNKFCFIGNYDCSRPIKARKRQLMDPKYFKANRTNKWYEEQFSNWTGSELVFYWR